MSEPTAAEKYPYREFSYETKYLSCCGEPLDRFIIELLEINNNLLEPIVYTPDDDSSRELMVRGYRKRTDSEIAKIDAASQQIKESATKTKEKLKLKKRSVY